MGRPSSFRGVESDLGKESGQVFDGNGIRKDSE
jgi:hypothetical protein